MKRLPLYPKFPDAPLSLAATLPQNPGCELCVLSKSTPSGQRCLSAEGVAGDILVVGEYPVEMERRMGRGFLSPPNKMLRDMLDRVAPGRKVVFANALGCSVPHTAEVGEAEATACRPYLADVLAEAKPQVILLLGPVAAMSVLGRSYQPLSVRKGYGWLRRSDGVLVPAFLLIQPREASRNPLMARALEEDLAWALNNPALQKAHFDAVCEVVETGADADEAFEHLMAQSEFLGTDVEASGMMHEDDYQIECLSISSGERTFVYPRQAFARPEIRYPLGLVLEGGQHTSWNGQYDWCGIAADPILREFRLNLQSDARIKRKLYEADARAKLEIAAELVGMGGHKEENHVVVEAICAELRTFAMSHLLTPTGKTRKWGGAKWFMAKEIPPQWVEWLNAEIAPEKFAHRFVPAEIEWRYNALDALSTWHLERWAMDKILNWEDGGLLAIWEEVSKPAMWAYNRMRLNGFPIDRQMLQTFRIWLEGEMAVSLKKIHGHKAGLNPLSNPQVVALMTELGLKTKRKTDSGKISASKEVLDELKDKSPVIGQISHYRTLQKIHGTYAVGLDPWIRSDGKVHASFLQDGTETGRPSSADPNLFNIAKGKDEASKEVATMLRGCFVAPPGWTIIEADSKQIEIRAAADLSGDPEMLAPIVAGADFHMNSAKKFAVAQGKDPEAVTDMDRDNAKTSVFAALYEIPCELGFMLSMRLKIPREDGGRLGGAMFKSFAQLRAWMDGQYADAHRTGRARTIWRGAPGRSRPLWGMGFNPATLKALETALEGERGSRSSGPSRYDKGAARSTYNGPSQGTAVDIIGSMLWRAQVWLDKNTRGGMLILQVYDSIMLLVRDEEVAKTVKFLQLLMTDQLEEKMGYTRFAPLGVDVKTGKAWSKMEKWKG